MGAAVSAAVNMGPVICRPRPRRHLLLLGGAEVCEDRPPPHPPQGRRIVFNVVCPRKEESEEEDGGEDDADVDGENKSGDETVPLLDQSLEISETKKVERLTEDFNELKETEAIKIPKGKGTPVGEIPRTDAFIKKFKADAVTQLHRVLFNRAGKVTLSPQALERLFLTADQSALQPKRPTTKDIQNRKMKHRKEHLVQKENEATDKENERDKEDVEDEPDEEASSDDSESKSKSKEDRRSQSKKDIQEG
ncbi:DEK domain-containing chromatin-associated protein 2-like [Schistocerca americana]|uniref:DEK domain-containing chromatin-associated protein 2-like n=1 Tax=Schistocerca americana TaxID=7009 RepID=UPI001F4F2E16|nr:DEK domain-containing chromatin-associated protein 2-like [Schistocerca americana]